MKTLNYILTFVLALFSCEVVLAKSLKADNSELKDKWQISIDAIVQPVIENGWVAGAVVGIITPEGDVVFGYGGKRLKGKDVPDGDTVFSIGSISKVFTSMAMVQMALDKELVYKDPVQKYLSESVVVPTYKNKKITLADLSMHISGLPRMPDNFKPKDPYNPYKDYKVKDLYAFLTGHQLVRYPGSKYEYSNLGAGLLGHVLAVKKGVGYEDVIKEIVLKPLGMLETGIKLKGVKKKRYAQGHDWDLKRMKYWGFDVLAGAGALRSTAHDMLKFLSANLGLTKTPLKKAMQIMQRPRRRAFGNNSIGFGWLMQNHRGHRVIWHNGGTYGFSSWAGFVKSRRVGVVVLSNTATFMSGVVDKIGLDVLSALLKTSYKPLDLPEEVKINSKLLKEYSGDYKSRSGKITKIKRRGSGLMMLLEDGQKIRLYAKSDDSFFSKFLMMNITFKRDNLGDVSRFVSEFGGEENVSRKVR